MQSCGVQLGKFHREVPTAIGGPAAGVWRRRADGPREVWHTGRGSSQGTCRRVQREERGYSECKNGQYLQKRKAHDDVGAGCPS